MSNEDTLGEELVCTSVTKKMMCTLPDLNSSYIIGLLAQPAADIGKLTRSRSQPNPSSINELNQIPCLYFSHFSLSPFPFSSFLSLSPLPSFRVHIVLKSRPPPLSPSSTPHPYPTPIFIQAIFHTPAISPFSFPFPIPNSFPSPWSFVSILHCVSLFPSTLSLPIPIHSLSLFLSTVFHPIPIHSPCSNSSSSHSRPLSIYSYPLSPISTHSPTVFRPLPLPLSFPFSFFPTSCLSPSRPP